MEISRKAFKAYDIRGKVPEELNEDMIYRIGRAYVAVLGAKKVAVGHDIRLSGPAFRDALVRGLTEGGCDVVDIGLCGTEQIYFAVSHLNLDGGLMITASHNPQDYNGMKLVGRESRPVGVENGLRDIENMVVEGRLPKVAAVSGRVSHSSIMEAYVAHLLTYIDLAKLKPLKVVVNAGNGGAGAVLDELEKRLPFTFVKVNHEPDGTFPHGVPNPLLPENREATARAVREAGADVGIAWDGDFDRCFFFDERGDFIEGYYIVGFLAQAFLRRQPGAKIIYDPRLTWNTIEIVEKAGGIPVQCKTGHVFIKDRMRQEDAVYGGEMSAHHYFKDFFYCDSGMIPWLLVLELICSSGRAFSELLAERIGCYPASGEINSRVADGPAVLAKLEEIYAPGALRVEKLDGLSIEYDNWRFNVRLSNTEPLLRLNVESRCDKELMQLKTKDLLALINGGRAG
ncbi:Phosphomannomutase [Propionispora sp. 2/2-37]|uniref:phosphomannomutase/phosphoglucomutase n=1 Tax=Propionispora sp. 2/2-37 TaxID=1677858 RepID=UPI0006BB57B6|nr:phosphomannomutase/phosphoglucomutase [Propionispora sp. 2/2-37]CUH94460.1 Phosphomannomutase [Propionispora sp. 2/2-37]